MEGQWSKIHAKQYSMRNSHTFQYSSPISALSHTNLFLRLFCSQNRTKNHPAIGVLKSLVFDIRRLLFLNSQSYPTNIDAVGHAIGRMRRVRTLHAFSSLLVITTATRFPRYVWREDHSQLRWRSGSTIIRIVREIDFFHL
jgi:hypothetical protein